MKENETNETNNQNKLETINNEMFHSFNPDDESGIVGGFPKLTGGVTWSGGPDVSVDVRW